MTFEISVLSFSDSLGKPGLPGSNDLETALRRLTMRKANEINEQLLREEDERQRKRLVGWLHPIMLYNIMISYPFIMPNSFSSLISAL